MPKKRSCNPPHFRFHNQMPSGVAITSFSTNHNYCNGVKNMLRKKTKEKIKKFDNEQFKIRFVKKTDEPQKEETIVIKNNGVGNNGKK